MTKGGDTHDDELNTRSVRSAGSAADESAGDEGQSLQGPVLPAERKGKHGQRELRLHLRLSVARVNVPTSPRLVGT